MNAECLNGIVVDICTRSFLLLGDHGQEKFVSCDTQEEFMNVLRFVKTNVTADQIEYADLAINE